MGEVCGSDQGTRQRADLPRVATFLAAADRRREERVRTSRAANRTADLLDLHRRDNLRRVTGLTREAVRGMKREGRLDAAGEARARASGLFGEDEEI